MARKKRVDENQTNGAVLILTVSLNLILLVFFVYINSIGANDQSKVKKALGSLVGTFGALPGGLSITPGKELLIPGAPLISQENSPVDIVQRFRELIKEEDIEEEVDIYIEGRDLVINLANRVLFDSGSVELHGDAIGLLERMSPLIKWKSLPVRIEGHTDNLPISTMKYPSNWELSAARAVAVLRHLSERYEIPNDRLSAVGFSEYQPLVPNDTPENRAKNRRVSIVLIGGGKGYEKKG